MSSNKKYIFSLGLAYFEEHEMAKLAKYAAKGWLLYSFAPIGYMLRKGEPAERVYAVDYNKSDPGGEYGEIFESAGWCHVCTSGGIHVFSAPKGTKAIYSDSESMTDKYRYLRKTVLMIGLVLLSVMIALLVAFTVTGWGIGVAGAFIIACIFALSVPFIMIFTAASIRLNHLKIKADKKRI